MTPKGIVLLVLVLVAFPPIVAAESIKVEDADEVWNCAYNIPANISHALRQDYTSNTPLDLKDADAVWSPAFVIPSNISRSLRSDYASRTSPFQIEDADAVWNPALIPLSAKTISLKEGWNLIEWTADSTTDIDGALAGLDWEGIGTYESGTWKSYVRGFGGSLTELKKGHKYYIKMNSEGNLVMGG